MIRVRALGALEIRDAGGDEARAVVSQPKRAALFAYLAVALPRGFHRRDSLVALFWPEQDEEHARNALNQAIHFLRRSLGSDVVSSHGDEVGIDRLAVWCDVVAFEHAIDAGRPEEAVDLYRGALLEGFHLPAAPEFDRWLDRERSRLANLYERAVETLATQREAAGDFTTAVMWWRRLAARDLYNSRVSLRLMNAMAAAGDAAGAIQHARVHETLLREELDAAPDPQIAALVRRLQQPSSSGGASLGLDPVSAREREWLTSPPTPEPLRRPRLRLRRAAIILAGVVLLAVVTRTVAAIIGPEPPSATPIRSIGVLPFETHSDDPAHVAFAAGMHDALITELARYSELTVISRTSMLRFKGTTKSIPEIADDLNVDAIVAGTLFWERGRVRMNAQLVRASDEHAWARSYRRDLREVLVLQNELAAAIAREVRVASIPAARSERRAVGPPASVPDELYLNELYLRGRHAEISRSLTGLLAAKEAHRRAIERDSTFALGYAGLATAYYLLADNDYTPMRPALDTARLLARRAVALDSTLPDTRTAWATMLATDLQFELAEQEFKRAIELNPSDARAHYWYSVLLVALGRGEEALREANRAQELDPFAPRGVSAMQRYARYLLEGGRPSGDRSPAAQPPVLAFEPGEPFALGGQGIALAEAGKCEEARATITQAERFAPGNNTRLQGQAGLVALLCGDRARAVAIAEAMQRRPDAHDHGQRIALLLAPLGERDAALRWLERTQWTLGQLSGLSADYRLDAIRSDPRFTALLQRIGIRKP